MKTNEAEVGIVLSPQRRSFLTGCQVSQPAKDETSENGDHNDRDRGGRGGSERPERGKEARSSVGKDLHLIEKPSAELSLRPDPNSSKRVGSGRIINRDRGGESDRDRDRDGFYRRSEDRFDRGFGGPGARRGGGLRGLDDRYDMYSQRPADPRNSGGNHRSDRGGSRGGFNDRYGGSGISERRSRLPYGRSNESEPEWMSVPVDQEDVMELRGFEDSSPEKESGGETKNRGRILVKRYLVQMIPFCLCLGDENNGGEVVNSWTDFLVLRKSREMEKQQDRERERDGVNEKAKQPADPAGNNQPDSLNIDDILHMDVIPGLANILDDNSDEAFPAHFASNAANAHDHQDGGAGSKFSQFFQKSANKDPSSDQMVRRKKTNQSQDFV